MAGSTSTPLSRDQILEICSRRLAECLAQKTIRVGVAFHLAASLAIHLEAGGDLRGWLARASRRVG